MVVKTRKQGNSVTVSIPTTFKIPSGVKLDPELRQDGIFYHFVVEEQVDVLDFDEFILRDLLAEGYSGETLISAFSKEKAALNQALKDIASDTINTNKAMTREEMEKAIDL
ncbi:AbrB family transcriptional regulator [Pseudolactococcus yaeyamensis]